MRISCTDFARLTISHRSLAIGCVLFSQRFAKYSQNFVRFRRRQFSLTICKIFSEFCKIFLKDFSENILRISMPIACISRIGFSLPICKDLSRSDAFFLATISYDIRTGIRTAFRAPILSRFRRRSLERIFFLNDLQNILENRLQNISLEFLRNSRKISYDFVRIGCISRTDSLQTISHRFSHDFVRLRCRFRYRFRHAIECVPRTDSLTISHGFGLTDFGCDSAYGFSLTICYEIFLEDFATIERVSLEFDRIRTSSICKIFSEPIFARIRQCISCTDSLARIRSDSLSRFLRK